VTLIILPQNTAAATSSQKAAISGIVAADLWAAQTHELFITPAPRFAEQNVYSFGIFRRNL
jgi:hypothetical protein